MNRQILFVVRKFRDQWSTKNECDFELYLEQIVPEYREQLLQALLRADLQMREATGQSVKAADYGKLGDDAVDFVHGLLDSRFATIDQVSPDNLDSTSTRSVPPPALTTPRWIGPYKLLQQIGEGGMGSVWMADQQEPVRRRVAVKVIKVGMDSRQVIARFEAERQALSMMDHPNIAKVLDAGMTEDGRPYFAMELVQGIPFTQYCDRNKLSPNERLELFVPVCQAIQHAHQKGIIHRDIKPSNVLVTLYDGKPVPKVIDFGLAKALQHQTQLTDKTMFTQFGQAVGTWLYMSPEQAEHSGLDVDTRSDIYSLGVLLYELLTGSTPLERETIREVAWNRIVDLICEKEPPRPSTRLSESGDAITGISEQRRITPSKLQQILKGELDWIVMKALEKDRTRRYETANGFAEDVQRYLDGDAVVARPPSTAYRVRKLIVKHRFLVGTAATIAFLAIGGFILGFMLVQSEFSKINAELEAERARSVSAKLGAISLVDPKLLHVRPIPLISKLEHGGGGNFGWRIFVPAGKSFLIRHSPSIDLAKFKDLRHLPDESEGIVFLDEHPSDREVILLFAYSHLSSDESLKGKYWAVEGWVMDPATRNRPVESTEGDWYGFTYLLKRFRPAGFQPIQESKLGSIPHQITVDSDYKDLLLLLTLDDSKTHALYPDRQHLWLALHLYWESVVNHDSPNESTIDLDRLTQSMDRNPPIGYSIWIEASTEKGNPLTKLIPDEQAPPKASLD